MQYANKNFLYVKKKHVYRISLAKHHYLKLRNIYSLIKVFEDCLTKYDEFALIVLI